MTAFDRSVYGNARVAAVVLARNEANTIADVVQAAAAFAHEVHVMDGHSSDDTPAIAARYGVSVHTDDGKGKGAAMRLGLALAQTDVVVFMDADGSHDAADIPKLALPLIRGEADLCVGSRFTGGSEELSVDLGQLVRTIGNISMNIAINKRWHVSLTDTLNGFRAVRRHAALQLGLVENAHTIEQEMVMKALRHGYKVINVPTHERARRYGTSHIKIWREWPAFVWCVIVNIIRADLPRRRF